MGKEEVEHENRRWDDFMPRELCKEVHKRVDDKLNIVSGLTKAILLTLVCEVIILGFLAIKGVII